MTLADKREPLKPRRKMKYLMLLTATLLNFSVSAHSGGTNSSGCHTNHKTGEYHCHNPKAAPRAVSSEESVTTVTFNTKTKKIHRHNCKSAKACTVNCVVLEKNDAVDRGGLPCGNCGG